MSTYGLESEGFSGACCVTWRGGLVPGNRGITRLPIFVDFNPGLTAIDKTYLWISSYFVFCIYKTDAVCSQMLYAACNSVSVTGRTAKAKLSTSSFASSGAVTDLNAEIEHATGLERCVKYDHIFCFLPAKVDIFGQQQKISESMHSC